MAIAVVKLDRSFKGKPFPQTKKVRVKEIAQAEIAAAGKSFLPNILIWIAGLLVIAASALGIAFYYFYTNAAAIVDQRIKLGFWQTRSGFYAAPHVLRKGQIISIEELVSILRHSGYVEGENKNIWNGNFTVKGETVSIQTNHSFDEQPEKIDLVFSQNQIVKIQGGKGITDAYELQPEMISGNSEAKRGSVNTLRFEQIPETLRNAIIITEDRRFFEHGGLDFRGIFRALQRNVADNEITQGGSTITQQFVKNVFLTREKTLSRKFSEAFLSLALENRLSKEDIFALYCNEIYLGQYGANGIHGLEQASRAYFGKNIRELNLAETATLVAMIKSPNKYAPHRNYEAAKERRDLVIQNMAKAGLISAADAERATAEEIALVQPKKNDGSLAPYFVDAVAKKIAGKDFTNGKNLRVYTTIDTQLQETAEKSVRAGLARLDKTFAKKSLMPQAALIALDPKNGRVLAMVGGRDYASSQLNRAVESRRQPGSTFKPFVYATALERGKLPTGLISDRPTAFPVDQKPYKPANYGNSYAMRDITMKTALAKSSNVAAVEMALESGLQNVARTAESFGLPKPPQFPSIALGTSEVTPLELAAAYAAFANGGKKVEPVFISRIVSGDGEILAEAGTDNQQVVSPQTAYMITDMLGAAVERGTARAAKDALGKNTAFVGKTGSSNDGWFVGYTPNLVCLVWVGFDEGDKDIGFTGGETALPIWVDFMKNATLSRPEFGGAAFPMPKGLVEVTIDPETGMIADNFCPAREKIVIPNRAYSNISCLRHQPKTEPMFADYTTGENASPEKYEISYQNEPVETNGVQDISNETYKSINGVPVIKDDKTKKIEVETKDEIKNGNDLEKLKTDSVKNANSAEEAKKIYFRKTGN